MPCASARTFVFSGLRVPFPATILEDAQLIWIILKHIRIQIHGAERHNYVALKSKELQRVARLLPGANSGILESGG